MNILSDSTVYLFGGAIRDYLNGELDYSRDLDFVIDSGNGVSIDISKYIAGFTDVSYKTNRFNGYKIKFRNYIDIDIWNLNDTWAFKNDKLYPSAENLIKSVYLNIDALVYSLNQDIFLNNCDVKYSQIKKDRMLDIVFDETPYEELNLLRALVFHKKYSLFFSKILRKRLLHYYNSDQNIAVYRLMELQKEHYNTVLLNKYDLISIFNDLNLVSFHD